MTSNENSLQCKCRKLLFIIGAPVLVAISIAQVSIDFVDRNPSIFQSSNTTMTPSYTNYTYGNETLGNTHSSF